MNSEPGRTIPVMNDATVARLRHRAAAIVAATLALLSVAAFAVGATLAADPSASPTSTEVPLGTTGGATPQFLILAFIGAAALGVIAYILIRRAMRSRGGTS